MKVIVAGATGLVGRALVRECVANPDIEHAYVLSRRPLAATEADIAASPKLTVLLRPDFTAPYAPDLLAQLADADACLWAIGGRATQFPDLATAHQVQVDFPVAFVKAFVAATAATAAPRPPFRFVFCSGGLAEQDPAKAQALRFLKDTRRLKGEAEVALLALAAADAARLQVWCARPMKIIEPPGVASLLDRAFCALSSGISSDRLAAAMAAIALRGCDQGSVLENADLLALAQKPAKT